MLDLSVSYNRYKFLGREFLTWLLFGMENDPSMVALSGEFKGILAVGNRIVFENNRNDRVEQVIIKGEDADLSEGMLALRKGALVSELSVVYTQGEHQWSFQLKGESLAPSGIVPPQPAVVETSEDVEGAVFDRMAMLERAANAIDALYARFMGFRIGSEWTMTVVPAMKDWIKSAQA